MPKRKRGEAQKRAEAKWQQKQSAFTTRIPAELFANYRELLRKMNRSVRGDLMAYMGRRIEEGKEEA